MAKGSSNQGAAADAKAPFEFEGQDISVSKLLLDPIARSSRKKPQIDPMRIRFSGRRSNLGPSLKKHTLTAMRAFIEKEARGIPVLA